MIGLDLSASSKFAVFDMFTNLRQNCEHFINSKISSSKKTILTEKLSKENIGTF